MDYLGDDFDSITVTKRITTVGQYYYLHSEIITYIGLGLVNLLYNASVIFDMILMLQPEDSIPVGTYQEYTITKTKNVTYDYWHNDGLTRTWRSTPVPVTNVWTETFLVGPSNSNYMVSTWKYYKDGAQEYLYKTEPWRRR